MTYRDGSVSEVRGSLDRARVVIGEAMASFHTTKDRIDSARSIINTALEGSIKPGKGAIIAALLNSGADADAGIKACLVAIEELDNFAAGL